MNKQRSIKSKLLSAVKVYKYHLVQRYIQEYQAFLGEFDFAIDMSELQEPDTSKKLKAIYGNGLDCSSLYVHRIIEERAKVRTDLIGAFFNGIFYRTNSNVKNNWCLKTFDALINARAIDPDLAITDVITAIGAPVELVDVIAKHCSPNKIAVEVLGWFGGIVVMADYMPKEPITQLKLKRLFKLVPEMFEYDKDSFDKILMTYFI